MLHLGRIDMSNTVASQGFVRPWGTLVSPGGLLCPSMSLQKGGFHAKSHTFISIMRSIFYFASQFMNYSG